MHTNVVDQLRENDSIKKEIEKREIVFDKMNNRIKESDRNLIKIQQDSKAMRRDLACFEEITEGRIHLISGCK